MTDGEKLAVLESELRRVNSDVNNLGKKLEDSTQAINLKLDSLELDTAKGKFLGYLALLAAAFLGWVFDHFGIGSGK